MNLVSVSQTLTLPLDLTQLDNKSLTVDFIGGLLLLSEVEQQIGIIKSITEATHDSRDVRYVKYSSMDLMLQCFSQIAAGDPLKTMMI